MTILTSFTLQRWSEYLGAEIASRQSIAGPAVGISPLVLSPPTKSEDFNDLTKAILRIVQLVTSYDSYFQSCFQAITSIQENINYISSITPPQWNGMSGKVGEVLDEHLRHISDEGRGVFWQLQSLKDRTAVQMNAVNHLSCLFLILAYYHI
jgi:hypothetical protein